MQDNGQGNGDGQGKPPPRPGRRARTPFWRTVRPPAASSSSEVAAKVPRRPAPRPASIHPGAADDQPHSASPSVHLQDLTAPLLTITGHRRLGKELAWEWSLVLEARGLPYRMERALLGYRLLVPVLQTEAVTAELTAYERENRRLRLPPTPLPMHDNTALTVGILLLLGLFHGIAQNAWRLFGYDAARQPIAWRESGMCDCFALSIQGEWWRSVTALTLHADAAHVLGNMGIGALVLVPLCRELGSGPGWFLTLLAGTLGNLLNCAVQGPRHLSLGASTAVFGAVGILSALRAVREGRLERQALLPPLGAGLALLALLGIGDDPKTDVGAHIFGFLAGLACGGLAGLLLRELRLERPAGLQGGLPLSATARQGLARGLGLLALGTLVWAWWLALR